jgi:hypothetical protein
VLKAGGDEGGDRQYGRNNLVGNRPAGIRKPYRQANEQVTQNSLEEQRHSVGLDLGDSRIQYRQADTASIHVEMMRKEDQDHKSEGTDQVTEIDDDPVAKHFLRRHISTRPGHHDQIVSREEFGSANQNDYQPKRKHHSSHHACRGETQRRVADDDGIVERA